MKREKAKESVLWVIVLGILAGSFLPAPWSVLVACVLLIPCVLYLIADIVKYRNQW